MSRNHKLRADSKLASLSLGQREELADLMLSGGVSQAEALEWLRERGVTMSATSLSQYYRNHILPTKGRRAFAAAAQLRQDGAGHSTTLKEATVLAIQYKLFEMATSQECDPKALSSLFKLIIASESNEVAERKLALLEQREADIRASLKPQPGNPSAGFSPEALARAEEALSLL